MTHQLIRFVWDEPFEAELKGSGSGTVHQFPDLCNHLVAEPQVDHETVTHTARTCVRPGPA